MTEVSQESPNLWIDLRTRPTAATALLAYHTACIEFKYAVLTACPETLIISGVMPGILAKSSVLLLIRSSSSRPIEVEGRPPFTAAAVTNLGRLSAILELKMAPSEKG